MTNEQQTKPQPAPTVGRIVHFYRYDNGPFAAIVDDVCEDKVHVDLHILGRQYFVAPLCEAVPYSDTPIEDPIGRWCYPPRV